jgi:hypothetical protein
MSFERLQGTVSCGCTDGGRAHVQVHATEGGGCLLENPVASYKPYNCLILIPSALGMDVRTPASAKR